MTFKLIESLGDNNKKPKSALNNIFAPPEKEYKPRGLFKVLDYVSRPLYAVAGGAKAVLDDENVLEEAKKGFLGKERETFSDVIGSLGFEPESKVGKIAKGIAGFGLDIVFDPLTYVGIGGLTKIGKGARALGKVSYIDDIAKSKVIGDMTIESFKNAVLHPNNTLRSDSVARSLMAKHSIQSVDDINGVVNSAISKGMSKAIEGGKLGRTAREQVEHGQRSLVTLFGTELVKGAKVFEKTGEMLDFVRDTKIVQTLGDAFIPNFRPTGAHPLIWESMVKASNAAKKVKVYSQHKAIEHAKDINYKMQGYIKKHGDEGALDILEAIERPEARKLLEGDAKELVDAFSSYRDSLKDFREGIGKNVIKGDDIKYLPHVHTEDIINDLKNVLGNSKVYRFAGPEDIQRKLYKVADEAGNESIVDITNKGYELLKDNKLKLPDGRVTKAMLPSIGDLRREGFKNIETDLGVLTGTMGMRHSETEYAYTFFENAKKLSVNKGGIDYTFPVDQAREVKDIPMLKGYKFAPEVYNEITKIYDKALNPKHAKGTIKSMANVHDKLLNGFKTMSTIVIPGFHARNFVSNIYQNLIGDVTDVGDYIIGTRIGIKGVKGKILSNKKIVNGLSEADLWKMYLKEGLREGHIYGDIRASLSTKLGGKSKGQKFIHKMGEKGDIVETTARMTHFVNKLKKGYKPSEAAESVKKYLFDYSDLTDFEKDVMKRVMPFYTWTRKNLPLQVETLATNPKWGSRVMMAKQEAEKATGIEAFDDSIVPDWLRDSAPIYLNVGGKTKAFRLTGFLPISDIMQTNPKEMLTQAVGMSNPLVKNLYELAANYNTFMKKPIIQYEGQRSDLFMLKNTPLPEGVKNVVAHPYLEHIVNSIRPLKETSKVINALLGPEKTEYSGTKQTLNLILGAKLYHIDKDRLRKQRKYLASVRITHLKRQLRKERKTGNRTEISRLENLIQQTKKGDF